MAGLEGRGVAGVRMHEGREPAGRDVAAVLLKRLPGS